MVVLTCAADEDGYCQTHKNRATKEYLKKTTRKKKSTRAGWTRVVTGIWFTSSNKAEVSKTVSYEHTVWRSLHNDPHMLNRSQITNTKIQDKLPLRRASSFSDDEYPNALISWLVSNSLTQQTSGSKWQYRVSSHTYLPPDYLRKWSVA